MPKTKSSQVKKTKWLALTALAAVSALIIAVVIWCAQRGPAQILQQPLAYLQHIGLQLMKPKAQTMIPRKRVDSTIELDEARVDAVKFEFYRTLADAGSSPSPPNNPPISNKQPLKTRKSTLNKADALAHDVLKHIK